MAAPAVEKVIADIDRLSAEQQQEVWQQLAEKLSGHNLHATNGQASAARAQADESPANADSRAARVNRDRTKEYEWLRQHSHQYYDQWVALEGDRLIAHDADYGKVRHAARAQGFDDALFILVEEDRAQSYRLKGDRIVGVNVPMKDLAREDAWLAQHQYDYAGQWLALDGDQLLSHGPSLKEVMAEARRKGVAVPLVVRAKARDALPFAGF